MYNIIKDEIKNIFNIDVILIDDNILLYSKDDDISDEMIQTINSSIDKYNHQFTQQNPKMALLTQMES